MPSSDSSSQYISYNDVRPYRSFVTGNVYRFTKDYAGNVVIYDGEYYMLSLGPRTFHMRLMAETFTIMELTDEERVLFVLGGKLRCDELRGKI